MKDSADYVQLDLSWCDFNARVLAEATDPAVPLVDRIKFLAIFSSNLDEFYRVKIAGLKKLRQLKHRKTAKWLGYDPKILLSEIAVKVNSQQEKFGTVWKEEIIPELKAKGIHIYQSEDIQPFHRSQINNLFRVHTQGLLPIIVSKGSKKIQLSNRGIYLVAEMKKKGRLRNVIGFVNIPTEHLSRFEELTGPDGTHSFIALDDIIRIHFSTIFSDYDLERKIYSIKLNRDEDYEIEDEFSGNLVDKIKEKVDRRMIGNPVRFLYDSEMPNDLLRKIMDSCNVKPHDAISGGRYHNLHDLFQLASLLIKHLPGQIFSPIAHHELENSTSIYTAMESKDHLLHFPYHRYDYVLRFFNEAAVDPNVTEVKVTLYRISRKSKIAQALITAAKNGKKVTVFVEVKARYDELNNIQWAKEMEKAGVSIIYSLPKLKVHAKVALVIKRTDRNIKKRYAYMATGNFNEKTATLYADHGLLTTSQAICKEVEKLFDYLKTKSRSVVFSHLMVASFNMKNRLLDLIDEEIEEAKNGRNAFIIIKVNGLDEPEMIQKLYEASAAGVKIQLIVRAGCSLVPGLKGKSENITAYRLVDMFLEHARVYWFCKHDANLIYLSSADWMNRNLNRRIEVAFPLVDPVLKEEIMTIINYQLADNVKLSSIADRDRRALASGNQLRAQTMIYHWIEREEAES